MTLYVLKYNNYYNRQSKGYTTLAEYDNYIVGHQDNINFNPNDGINTTAILNLPHSVVDYAIVADGDTIVSRWFILDCTRTRGKQYQLTLKRDVVYDNIDAVQNATCFVEKGMITNPDNPLLFNKENMGVNQIKKKEILLQDETHIPWICAYFAKNMTELNCTVDYNPESDGSAIEIGTTLANWKYYGYSTAQTPFIANTTDIQFKIRSKYKFGLLTLYARSIIDKIGQVSTNWSWAELDTEPYVETVDTINTSAQVTAAIEAGLESVSLSTIQSRFDYYLTGSTAHTDTVLSDLLSYNGQKIKDTNGDYYYISIVQVGDTDITNFIDVPSDYSDVITLLTSACSGLFKDISTITSGTFQVAYQAPRYVVNITPITALSGGFSIPTTKNSTDDALYDIIAIPYGNLPVKDTEGNTIINNTSTVVANAIASSISKAAGSNLYDLQLLPYCPCADMMKDGYAVVDTTLEGKTYIPVKDADGDIIGIMFTATKATFSKTITQPLNIERTYTLTAGTTHTLTVKTGYYITKTTTNSVSGYIHIPAFSNDRIYTDRNSANFEMYTNTLFDIDKVNYTSSFNLNEHRLYFTATAKSGSLEKIGRIGSCLTGTFYVRYTGMSAAITSNSALDKKVSYECDLCRLVSPNYSGQFEFSVAKNDGVNTFNVDCTYKPYSPYIHVNPTFKSIYGENFHDARGLICGGDFSFGQLTDKFAEYELQNKNYEQIFNRQIDHMDTMNSIEMGQQVASMISGTVTGAVSGATAGTLAGGLGVGTAVGAGVGAAASLGAGIADTVLLGQQQAENKKYAQDMYGYNLGNIKALPYSLTKCSAFTANNKLFPFIELYSCTPEERQLLRRKLTYDGMTVMAIDCLANYIGKDESFVRGNIIRIDVEDSHMANEIYNEIQKGVYF